MNRNETNLNPAEWNGKNPRCKEPFCGAELDMNDYDNICNECHNKEEEETPIIGSFDKEGKLI